MSVGAAAHGDGFIARLRRDHVIGVVPRLVGIFQRRGKPAKVHHTRTVIIVTRTFHFTIFRLRRDFRRDVAVHQQVDIVIERVKTLISIRKDWTHVVKIE
jgi:hypothetical protein